MRTAMMRQVMFRITPEEFDRLKEAAGEDDRTISEFVRGCVNRELALRGDPKAAERVATMFREAIDEYVRGRVAQELQAAK